MGTRESTGYGNDVQIDGTTESRKWRNTLHTSSTDTTATAAVATTTSTTATLSTTKNKRKGNLQSKSVLNSGTACIIGSRNSAKSDPF